MKLNRVAASCQIKKYLGYAFRILNKTDHRFLTVRATGNAIVKEAKAGDKVT